jgi:hypothetical protein
VAASSDDDRVRVELAGEVRDLVRGSGRRGGDDAQADVEGFVVGFCDLPADLVLDLVFVREYWPAAAAAAVGLLAVNGDESVAGGLRERLPIFTPTVGARRRTWCM